MDTADKITAQRRALAELIETLPPGDLDRAIGGDGWTPRLVLAHAVALAEAGKSSLMLTMARCGFDRDRAADRLTRRTATRPVAELTETLRAKADRRATGSFSEELLLADIVIRTQDIRRTLGLEAELERETVRAVLTFLATHRQAGTFVDRTRLEGVHFETTDLDWRHGTGPCVEGSGEALMMTLAGRPAAEELHGPGLDQLLDQLLAQS